MRRHWLPRGDAATAGRGREGEVSSVQSNREGLDWMEAWLYFASSRTSSRLASPVAQGRGGRKLTGTGGKEMAGLCWIIMAIYIWKKEFWNEG
jgi:hypothetical protein